jgi:hypothetical protein
VLGAVQTIGKQATTIALMVGNTPALPGKFHKEPDMSRYTAALAALVALGACGVAAAHVGEITLYEKAGFDGRAMTLREVTPDFSAIAFSDSAASIVVRVGSWEVCTEAQFKGRCLTLQPGIYNGTDDAFHSRIASAREVGGSGGDHAHGSVDLFGEPDFRGMSLRISRDAGNFRAIGFYDRATSIIVNEGTWSLCTDAEFGGECHSFPPGRYSGIGGGMDRAMSSARSVHARGTAPVVHLGGWPGRHGVPAEGRAILNAGDNMQGRNLVVTENATDLRRTGFNNETASIVVEGGSWEFCTDSYFRGKCRVLGPGRYPLLEPAFYRTITSVRAAASDGLVRRPGTPPGDIVFFEEVNLDGRSVGTVDNVPNLNTLGFDDRASSLVVYAGQWEICSEARFGGRCAVFGPGRYASLGGLDKHISSLSRVD